MESNESAISTGNQTTELLLANGVFTGKGERNFFPSAMVSCRSDVAGTLYFEFSNENEIWTTFPTGGFAVSAGEIHEFHTAVKGPRYFRVRYVNGSSSQSSFFLYTYYGNFGSPNAPLNQAIGQDADASVVRSTDSVIDISKGLVSGHANERKFGRNDAVTDTEEDLWSVGGTYNWLTAAATVRIKAGGNVNDVSGGSGAQSVTIFGLDENWALANETITTNGASESGATTTTFIRVFRAQVTNVGTYTGANTGIITIETSGGTTVCAIPAGEGQSQLTMYTVPANKTAYVYEIVAEVDGGKSGNAYFWQRQNADDVTTPFTGKRLIDSITALSGQDTKKFPYVSFPAKTDLWMSGLGPSAGASIHGEYYFILVDD